MRLMTIREICLALPIYTDDLHRAIKRKELPHYKIGRTVLFDWDELLALSRVETQSEQAAQELPPIITGFNPLFQRIENENCLANVEVSR